ncbi:DUF2946 family protein [Bradyrhizobium sp.]|uniref:DUF2946 family protein n=1 Tax=Bradyrhizobium sp. TaxID=376 RepID=UPI0039E5B9F7
MTSFGSRRRVGVGTAFIAAYALVLNVILSSILIASFSSISPAAAHEICMSGVDTDPTDADKSGHKTTIHCPLCIGHHVTGGLPPPDTVLAERVALRAEAICFVRDRLVAHIRSSAHLSRGPPALT